MTLVTESQIEDPPPTTTQTSSNLSPPTQTTTTATQVQEMVSRAAWRQGVLGALQLAARVLAARAILLIATLGAIGLAYMAINAGDWIRLASLAVYLVGGVAPLVWLASRA
jgi:hypothetical protein